MDTEPPTIVRYTQTCSACPSQWDAWDANGQYYYLRYRFGRGTVETAASADDYVENGPTAQVAAFLDGDPMQGEIELDEFLRLAGMRLTDDAHREPDAPQIYVITGPFEEVMKLYGKDR